jgi:hypothetical protein
MSEIRTVMTDKGAGDHRYGRNRIVIEISLRSREQLRESIKRDQRGSAPRGDRQDLPHEAAHHGKQARNQHYREQDEIEYRYRHRLVRSARKFSSSESAGRYHPSEGQIAHPARLDIAPSRSPFARVV